MRLRREARLALLVALAGAGAACRDGHPPAPPPRPASVAVASPPAAPAQALEGEPAPAASARTAGFLASLRDQLEGLEPSSGPEAAHATVRLVDGGLRPFFGADVKTLAHVTSPRRATAATHLSDAGSGVAVDINLVGASDVAAEVSDGDVVFPRAHASGATWVHRPSPNGLEDLLSFESRPRVAGVSYRLALGDGVKGLRLVANTLELVDAGGAPRLRVTAPYVVGADGDRTDATLAIAGCSVDRSPAGPWGRPVTAPGHKTCTLRVSWNDKAVAYPAVLDPRWTATGNMIKARQGHTATLIGNGKVLAAGGTSSTTLLGGASVTLPNAELYDRTTNTWAATTSMPASRQLHGAVLLGATGNANTANKVLVTGGWDGTASQSTAYLYDTTAGTWTSTPAMPATRHGHTTTLLANGQVLVAGGQSGTTGALMTAATYNPGGTSNGTWTATNQMTSSARGHTATLITGSSNSSFNNKVLIVGGINNSSGSTIAVVQLFDGTSSFSTVAALPAARDSHAATLVAGGKVLVTGGKSGTTTFYDSTVLFNPGTSGTSGSWASAGTMTSKRELHTATLLTTGVLSNGQVLVVGGNTAAGGAPLATAELWNGTTTWTATSALTGAVEGQTATLLANGAVLIAGGLSTTSALATAGQVYDPSWALSCTSNSQCALGFCVNGVCCDTACNTGCGACNLSGKVGTCSPVAVNTACPDDGNACTTDMCDGTTLTCQHAAGNAGATCRAAAGECDVAETCTGTSTTCPTDAKKAANTACTDDGNVCTTDLCDGTNVACQHVAGNAGTTCRAAGGECDVAETCTGTSTTCPTDAKKASGTACTDDGNVCTTDLCDGTNVTCQHAAGNAGTTCRAAGGECDVAETCTGTSTTCPTDAKKASGTACTDDGLGCTSDLCNGSSNVCQHATLPSGTVCRAAGGECDLQETCDGTSTACPTDAKKASGTTCTDDGLGCTKDQCDGTSVACQHPTAAAGTVCRAAAGACDAAETCDGNATTCPADQLSPAGTVCRPAASGCDIAEACTGTTASCPADTFQPNGTFCDDGNLCTAGDTCQAGACTPGPVLPCHAIDQCHDAGVCSPQAGGCSNPPKTDGTTCNDGNACTQTDTCQAGLCTGGNPITCADPDVCHTAACDPAGGPNYPTSGLVGLWHLDGNGGDSSDGANDFSVITNADVVTGERGSAYLCSSTTCLNQPTAASNDLSSGTGVTIAGWVNPSAACPGTWTLFQRGQQVALQLTCAGPGAPGLSYAINTGSGLAFSAPFGSVPQNQWSFVALTWDTASQTAQLFVNGSSVHTFTQPGPLAGTASTMYLGCGGTSFVGTLDEFALYDRALDATTEVPPLAGAPTMCKSASKCGDPDGCNTRTCDMATGACSAPNPKPDGTACSDGQGCTQSDVCQGGVCQSGTPVTCAPSTTVCNESVCDPSFAPPAAADVVAQWNFDGNLKDSSANANDFTGGGGDVVVGKDGQAMHFGPTAACAFLPARPSDNINNPAGATLAAWVKPDVHFCSSGASGHVLELQNAFGFRLVCRPDGTIGVSAVAYSADGFGGVFNPAGTLPEGQWTHVAVGFARSSEYLFINGDFVEGDGYPGTNEELPRTGNGFYLGCSAGAAIDDAILFRHALSTTEIGALYASPSQCSDRPKVCLAADSCHQNGTCDPSTGECPNDPQPNGTPCSTGSSCTTDQTCAGGTCGGGAPVCPAPSAQCEQATCSEATAVPTPPQTGLVGWWRFEGDAKDSSGNHLDLQNQGAQLVAGKVGQAMQFDGTDCLSSPIGASGFTLPNASGVTMMAWVKVASGPSSDGFRTVMAKGSDYAMVTNADSSMNTLVGVTGTARPIGDQRLGYPGSWGINYDGSWALIAVTWDHHTLQFWVNGVAGSSLELDGIGPSSGDVIFHIGCNQFFGVGQPDPFQYFHGLIDEATLYSRALTGAEIAQYYADSTSVPAAACGTGPAPDGASCNDGNACTSNDTCHLGTCYGVAQMSCPQPGPCQVLAGTCDPQSGCPAPVAAPNGTACDDGNACTRSDSCEAGACVGANPVTCPGADECHAASTCDMQTGTCSTPAVTGTSTVCAGGQYDYDKAGRLVRDHATTLVYDAYDQLVGVVPGPASGTLPFSNLPVANLGYVGGGSFSDAVDVNASGQIAVQATDAAGVYHALIYTSESEQLDVNPLAGTTGNVFGNVVTSNGILAGSFAASDGKSHIFRYSPAAGFQDLGTFGDSVSGYYANSRGQVTGPYQSGGMGHGYVYTDGTGFQDIGTLGRNTVAWCISEDGTVGASSQPAGFMNDNFLDYAHFGHAVIYDDVLGLQDLNNLADPAVLGDMVLVDAFRIVGDYIYGDGLLEGKVRPYRMKRSTHELMFPPDVEPGDIFIDGGDEFGDMVGSAYADPNQRTSAGQHAWVYYEDRGLAVLDDIVDPTAGWAMRQGNAMNDVGDIVGFGFVDGKYTAYRVRLPVRTSGATGPALASMHTYGYDGLRTSTTTSPMTSSANVQFWFTQDYTQHDGVRDHYIRVGDRIVAKVTYGPPSGGTGMGLVRTSSGRRSDDGDPVGKTLLALMLSFGLAATAAGVVGKKRRPAWVAATAGPVTLFFLASCEMLGGEKRSAQTVWQRVEVVYFHQGIGAGPVLTTNSDGTPREERRYEPFGQPVDAFVGTTLGDVDFRREPQNSLGKLTDPNTGWSYQGERWMQPQTARWLTPDMLTKGPDPKKIASHWTMNPYTFTGNNPAAMWDPSGAYEENIHGALTYALASLAGFNPNQSATIALSCAGVDHALSTQPLGTTSVGWINKVIGFVNAIRGVTAEMHFASPEKALSKVYGVIKDGKGMNLVDLGKSLHTLEDVGFKDALGPHKDGEPTPVGIGHPTKVNQDGTLSTYRNHTADQAFRNPERNKAELRKVFYALVDAAKANGYTGQVDFKAAYDMIDKMVEAGQGISDETDAKKAILKSMRAFQAGGKDYLDQVWLNKLHEGEAAGGTSWTKVDITTSPKDE